jgi:hypothetical protein
MAGRGPAPKLGENLGKHLTKAQQTRKGKATVAQPERRPVPAGDWHPRAVAWWEGAMGSVALQAWDSASWASAERLIALVHAYWTAFDEGSYVTAGALSDRIRLLEQPLYLLPVDRVRAVRDGVLDPPQVEVENEAEKPGRAVSRARLRAVEAG